jgi:hypothetical protein
VVDDASIDAIRPVARKVAFAAFGAEAVERVIRAANGGGGERDVVVLGQIEALGDGAREPVAAPGGETQSEIVAVEPGVVPERVDADAGIEAEVDERDGHDAGLVVRTECEKIVERRRQLGSLGLGDHEFERAPDHVLGHDVRREKHDARHPQRYVPGRRPLWATVVVRHGALRFRRRGRFGERAHSGQHDEG